MSRIGIFGGTFNPIHKGHILLAEYCRREGRLNRVILIPDRTPPHKQSPDLASVADRLEMCRIASEGHEFLSVSDIELRREGKSYTYETLLSLKEIYPEDELWLIVGADMFLTLHSWREPETIFRCASVIVAPRDMSDREQLETYYREVIKPMGARAMVLPSPVMEVSSTLVRGNIADEGTVRPLLPGGVYEYIIEKGLYRK